MAAPVPARTSVPPPALVTKVSTAPAPAPAPRSPVPISSTRTASSPAKPLSSPGAVIGALPAKAVEDDPPDLDPEEPDRPPRQAAVRRHTAGHVTHVVRRNETLWDIARHYDVPVSSVRRANPGKKLKPLMPGTRLRIPVKTGRT
jgi:nucleoid-associated protein YgaU